MSISTINIPKLGMSMVAADLVEWKAREGDRVEKGDVVLSIETEKVTWDVEAPAAGFLHSMEPSGKTVKVGAQVGAVAQTREEYEGLALGVAARSAETLAVAGAEPPTAAGAEPLAAACAEPLALTLAEPQAATCDEPPAVACAEPTVSKPVFSTPAARRLAAELGVDLASVQGTGPEGRITEKDVAGAQAAPKATPLARRIAASEGVDLGTLTGTREGGKIGKLDVEQAVSARCSAQEKAPAPGVLRVVPMNGMRKAIADNMYASLHNTAQVTVSAEVDVTDSLGFLESVQERYGNNGALKVSFTDLLVMAVARALQRVPILNSNLTETEIVLFDAVHMGIAVAVPEGLIVPVLRDAGRKGLLEIARETRELAQKAREGRLGMEEITGGTFTISNVSMFEIDGSTPILKPPETGILAAGRIRAKPAVHEGEICVRSTTTLCLTFDHRVVDGAEVGEFMGHLGFFLRSPNLMLA